MSGADHPKDRARDYYSEGKYEKAGEYFTSAAYKSLGGSVVGENVRSLANGLYWLLFAGLSFRRAQEYERCSNRASQGILIAEDVRDFCYEDKADKGTLTEYVGDFETIGGVGSSEDSYRKASQYYAESGSEYTTSRNSDPLDSRLYQFFERVLGDAKRDLPDWFQPRYAYTTRANFKAKEFDAILEEIEERQTD